MNELVAATSEEIRRAERIQVMDSIPVLDTGRFEHMQRIASVMAQSSMIPDALYTAGSGNDKKELPLPAVISNCFLVVNQAVRWGMDPFAVAQCVSIISGRICYEGKLIAAVLDAKLGLRLIPEYDEGHGDQLGVTIYAYTADDKAIANPRTGDALVVKGTVGDWKTTRTGSPWAAGKAHKSMLMYRGSREWVRLYRPAIMLGVYAVDEMEDFEVDRRSQETPRRAPVPTLSSSPSKEPVSTDQVALPKPEENKLTRRAPPPPPHTKSEPDPAAEATVKDVYDFEDVRKRYVERAKQAQTGDELEAIWQELVEPAWDSFFPPDADKLLQEHRHFVASLEP
jgi:hypothetical protein